MHDAEGLYEFVRISEVTATTKQLLALNLQQKTRLGARCEPNRARSDDPVEHFVLQQARDFVGQVREGFVLSTRQQDGLSVAEMRYLLDRVLHDWSELSEEIGLGSTAPGQIPGLDAEPLQRVRHQLLAFGMAVTALGYLPRTPSEEITFPYSYGKPPTYGDIPSPASPAELLQRIDEVERMIWKGMSLGWQELVNHHYGALRRTYGFFEANALLASREAERFGVKKPGSGLALLS